MATDKPRFTITLPEDIYAQVMEYKAEQNLSTQSKAIQRLIALGLSATAEPIQVGAILVEEDMAVARDYHELDAHGKKLARLVMATELERIQEAVTPAPHVQAPKTKVIPLFPAAAGPGELMEDIAFDQVEVPADSRAEFAVRVSGDSMEPELSHGDIVYCVKRYPEIGELAAVMVNGFLYLKQFDTDGHNIFLLSLNRGRRSQDVYLFEGSDDSVKCYGTVLHGRVPLVDH